MLIHYASDDANPSEELPQSSSVKGILKKEKEGPSKKRKSVNFEMDNDSVEQSDGASEEEGNSGEESTEEQTDSVSEQSEDSDNNQEDDSADDGNGVDDDEGSDFDNSETPSEPSYKEDIYGRLRDDVGNVVGKGPEKGSYVPPGKRLEMAKTTDEKKKAELERMTRRLKGLVNR